MLVLKEIRYYLPSLPPPQKKKSEITVYQKIYKKYMDLSRSLKFELKIKQNLSHFSYLKKRWWSVMEFNLIKVDKSWNLFYSIWQKKIRFRRFSRHEWFSISTFHIHHHGVFFGLTAEPHLDRFKQSPQTNKKIQVQRFKVRNGQRSRDRLKYSEQNPLIFKGE